jgi:hypothetical protein
MPTKGRNHAHRYDNMKRMAESQVHFKPTNHQIVLGENMCIQFLSFFLYLFIYHSTKCYYHYLHGNTDYSCNYNCFIQRSKHITFLLDILEIFNLVPATPCPATPLWGAVVVVAITGVHVLLLLPLYSGPHRFFSWGYMWDMRRCPKTPP